MAMELVLGCSRSARLSAPGIATKPRTTAHPSRQWRARRQVTGTSSIRTTLAGYAIGLAMALIASAQNLHRFDPGRTARRHHAGDERDNE